MAEADEMNIFMSDDDESEQKEVKSMGESDEEGSRDNSQEESDAESVASSIKEGVPDALQDIFSRNDVTLAQNKADKNKSLFTKTKAEQVATESIEDAKRRKAEQLFQQHSLFASGTIAANAKQIKPLNSGKLDQKERQKERDSNTGKQWGYMPKVELTDELKMDLKAIQMRNQIFPKRFYRGNDSTKLPEYFQIGTVVDDGGIHSRVGRLTKKDQRKSIA